MHRIEKEGELMDESSRADRERLEEKYRAEDQCRADELARLTALAATDANVASALRAGYRRGYVDADNGENPNPAYWPEES